MHDRRVGCVHVLDRREPVVFGLRALARHIDIPDEYASDSDRAAAAARRQNWREGADMMQVKLREAVQAQDAAIPAQLDPARAAQVKVEAVEQALRYAIRRNASGSPDRLATGQEVLDVIYAELAEHSGLTGVTSADLPERNATVTPDRPESPLFG